MEKPLTLAVIKRLVAAGESETLELKRSTGELREGMEALCGLLNHRGGIVIFGVAPDGRSLGQPVTESTLHDVTAALRTIDPAPRVDLTRVKVDEGRALLVLRAASGDGAPYTYD